ncbi:hypothetical protein N7509_012544 [Penicillium cosmopolitanum]|uniref:Uncharacterized protein n=1 Tax=Penicillium cosmopolitanum TaxID=1131564 RepID=A0A9W9SK38_9EURO|nr:uncharacterized protein N7509_012544 [Penicillium cosmopolitanum]KAJ5379425.1 hypothetical protein N7509_012544 [Penicillium cosmopolitanum]
MKQLEWLTFQVLESGIYDRLLLNTRLNINRGDAKYKVLIANKSEKPNCKMIEAALIAMGKNPQRPSCGVVADGLDGSMYWIILD